MNRILCADLHLIWAAFQFVGICFLVAFTAFQICCYVFLRSGVWKNPGVPALTGPLPACSVVICAHNERHNLSKNLPKIAQQEYPGCWEIVVVDDCSNDGTLETLNGLSEAYPRLRVIRLENKREGGKKRALSEGIKQAQYSNLVCTDADCRPASTEWLQGMTSAFSRNNQNELVLGCSPLNAPPTLFGNWVAYESMHTAFLYIGMAARGYPYMGVGRNIAFQRKLWESTGGNEAHQHLMSGDDDLFVNAAAHRNNTAVVTASFAYTHSPAPATLSDWWKQKRRHLSTGGYYQRGHRLFLGWMAGTHVMHYFLGFLSLVTGYLPLLSITLYACRLAVVVLTLWQPLKMMGRKPTILFVAVQDLLFSFHYGLVVPYFQWVRGGGVTWKNFSA
jgi:cellulose synthase/poly-beta-1,6-N-acetylglucosamine synthase-like glycosyltransferase